MDATITKNEKAKRFEINIDNALALIDYELANKTIILIHTTVPKELEGHGLGSKIAKFALEYAKTNGLNVVPKCPFIKSYIEHHEEYKEIVSE